MTSRVEDFHALMQRTNVVFAHGEGDYRAIELIETVVVAVNCGQTHRIPQVYVSIFAIIAKGGSSI